MLSSIRQPCDEAVVRSQPEVTDCVQAAGRWVLAAAILGSGITFIDGTVVNVALSRWAGGLVERYGSRLPLVVGPVIAASGFALFAVPSAEAGSYWTSFFPAVMVMSVGMAMSVAPLTTTVMGAVEERHAGVASGINNAVSRSAALLAVAVFGVVMLNAFNRSLAERLCAMPVSSEARAQLLGRSGDFVNLKIPDGVSGKTQTAIRQAVRESFVAGFRVVAYLAAGLAAASALVSLRVVPGCSRASP
jgi:hypothetical protein